MEKNLIVKNPVVDLEEILAYVQEYQMPHRLASAPDYFFPIKLILDETNAEIVRSKFGLDRVDFEERIIL